MKGGADRLAGAARYADFRAAVFANATLREPPLPRDPAGPMPEIEMQARWFAGEFGRKFLGANGEPVEIVQFGHWNHAAGPDFTECAVRIGDRRHTGAIEVDRDAANWESHGHGANPAFDDVVLHVFFAKSPPATGPGAAEETRFFTRDSRHRAVAQVALDPAALAGGGEARPFGWIPEARLGRCATPLREFSGEALDSLLTAAAQFRLLEKNARLRAIADAHSEDQALFQALAEALGFRHNRFAMAALAQRLPMKRLRREEPDTREALLFGAAGFIDHEHYAAAEPEARRYLKELWDRWWRLRDAHEPDAERRLHWRVAGARPVNHPQRRVAALAALANHWRAFRAAMPSPADGGDWPKTVRRLLTGLEHPYWSTHYTLRSAPSAKPMALVGKDRVLDILGNVLFPLAVAADPAQWERFKALPGAVSNEKLRRATLRLFGENDPRTAECVKAYYRQQALLQIYRDFCLEDFSECAECPFPGQLLQWNGEG